MPKFGKTQYTLHQEKIFSLVYTQILYTGVGGGGGGGGGGISSDGDDKRICLGLKFSILGIFSGRNIWQVFLGGGSI